MKKVLSMVLLACLISTTILATKLPDPKDKIIKIFMGQFPKSSNAQFYNYGDSYMVYYTINDHSSGRAFYNLDGSLIKNISYYSALELSPFIKNGLSEKFKGKDIFGVTETEMKGEHTYQVTLQDKEHWYMALCDDYGNINLEKKYKKQ